MNLAATCRVRSARHISALSPRETDSTEGYPANFKVSIVDFVTRTKTYPRCVRNACLTGRKPRVCIESAAPNGGTHHPQDLGNVSKSGLRRILGVFLGVKVHETRTRGKHTLTCGSNGDAPRRNIRHAHSCWSVKHSHQNESTECAKMRRGKRTTYTLRPWR